VVIILAFLLISWCIHILSLRISSHESPKNANKNSPMKHKYMTEQGKNSDEEGTTENKQKPSQ